MKAGTTPLRVVVVEDHDLTRTGLLTALSDVGRFIVVGEAADGISAWELIARTRPDVAVVDIGLPGMDGIELTRRIRAELPRTRVLIVTMHDLETEVLAALAAGADAYALKTTPSERIASAVQIVGEGGAYFDPQIAHVVLRAFGPGQQRPATASSPLTPRETEILKLIADGIGNAEIAERLNLGLGTVKGHVRDILEKLAAADRTQAAVIALRRGLI